MKRREFAGLPIVVENEAGSTRFWHDRDGRVSGQTEMKHDYGFIEGHMGPDGDEVDCYLGPDEAASMVYVVHQNKAPDYKAYDEDKVMLGFRSEAEAKAAYLAHRNDGERAYGGMTAMPLERFKEKLERRSGTGKIRHGQETKSMSDSLRFVPGRSFLFDAERGPDGRVRTGVWDRFTSWGEKIKEGRRSVFDEVTLGQMVDNWRARGDELAMCYNHQSAFVEQNGQPAPALAFYNALAIIKDGQVLRCEALGGAGVAPPDATGRGDGLYGYRCEVTEIGQQLLPNFKFISPMFISDGHDEEGREIGYVLYDVAATNTPFQAGCEITFDSARAGAPTTGATKMALKLGKLTKFVKCEEGADDKAIRQAVLSLMEETAMKAASDEGFDYAAEAAKCEEMAKAYEDAHMDDDGDEPPHAMMRKMAAKFRRMAKLEEPADENADEKAKQEEAKMERAKAAELRAFAQRMGVKVSEGASSKEIFDALQAAAVPASSLPSIIDERVKAALAEADKKRQTLEVADKAKALVEAAVAGGYPAARKESLLAYASNPATFEDAKAMCEPFLKSGSVPAALFHRFTTGGAPLGAENRRETLGAADRRVVRMDVLQTNAEVFGENLSKLTTEMADSQDPKVRAQIDKELPDMAKGTKFESFERLSAAYRIIRRERPDLWKAAEETAL